MTVLCECVCGNACVCVCVTLSAVACLRGGSLLDTFLVLSKHIVCEWLPVIASLELCLLPNHATAAAFPSLSHSLSFFLTPESVLSLLVSLLSVCFSFSASLCILAERWYRGLEVGVLWSVYLIYFFTLFHPKAFNHETTNVGLHEIPARPGCSFHL